ncbi:hypothetical protein LCI18_007645 [Fusarium solani-melongenae]|uniref:Uncharacterized protein n=1 Tax=Fusarium solani subsp. cucurbitae TaxID=2747967 RepID=A0ACD3Z657_FUSSC|nr:hypothetical protein LCI18_007645 [Fusarium solani-melongenae]
MSTIEFTIPEGFIVLVTGASGLVGSHVADQFLHDVFNKKYGTGQFELLSIPDMAADDAFTEAVKGVSAVAHVASVTTFDPDPNKVIPTVIAGAVNALKAAFAEPSVKRFVYTSSSTAALLPKPNVPGIVVTEGTWNDEAVKLAWSSKT